MNRLIGRLPKVGIRPVIDGREAGVRESLEDQCMDMAKAAGVTAIGVTWGYHDRTRLTAADHIAETFEEIPPLIETLLG